MRDRPRNFRLDEPRPAHDGEPAPSPRAPGSPRIPDCLPRRVGSIPAPGGAPRRDRSRIDLGRRDLSRRAQGAPALRVSGSGAGRRKHRAARRGPDDSSARYRQHRSGQRGIDTAIVGPCRGRLLDSMPPTASSFRANSPQAIASMLSRKARRSARTTPASSIMTWLTSPADPKMATTITQTPTVNFTSLLTSANLLQHRRKSSSARAAASELPHRA